MQTRENALHKWLKTIYPDSDYSLAPLAGDASFRRYYRLHHAGITQIIMDSPPDRIPLAPFVYVRRLLAEQGVRTPQIYAIDDTLGFAVLEDFGNVLLQDALNQSSAHPLYQSAIQILTQIHHHHSPQPIELQHFDQTFMLQELNLFHDWFLQRYLGLSLNTDEHQLLQTTFQNLTTQIANQPQVLIHRDYHSRNIMLLDRQPDALPKFGIIDFQDAMIGPITYDLVSLLKDCYIQLSQDQISFWLHYFYQQSQLTQPYEFSDLQHAFDWCGLQRHLRILGTFCRLHLRDGKSNYLHDLPRTYQYVTTCVQAYPELHPFGQWLQHRVHAHFQGTLA